MDGRRVGGRDGGSCSGGGLDVLGSAHVAAFLARVPASEGDGGVRIVTSLPAANSTTAEAEAEFDFSLIKCTGVLVDGDMVVVVVPSSHKISLKQVAAHYSVGTNHRHDEQQNACQHPGTTRTQACLLIDRPADCLAD